MVATVETPTVPRELKSFGLLLLSGTLLFGVLWLIFVPVDGVWRTIAPGIPTEDSPASEFANTAYVLANSDPVADALEALRVGDRRLWAGGASSWFIPGAPEEKFLTYQRRYGLRFFYAGCDVHSDEEIEFRNVADAYAERYNKTLLAAVDR
jgi:hypothetical protein